MSKEINAAYTRVLRRLRFQKNLSQEQLGFEADLHRTYISQLERGLKSPSLETVFKLANTLNISVGDLIHLVEDELNEISMENK